MTPLRLALVTRRFWPLTGEAEQAAADLAAGLRERGHLCTVVTPRYGRRWPAEVCVREASVVRLPHPPPHRWGNMRYLFALSNWLQRRRDELDAVLVEGFDDEALTVAAALRNTQVPVVARVDATTEPSTTGNVFGEKLRRRARELAAFVATSPLAAEQLVATGVPAERVTIVPLGVETPSPCGPARRDEARQSLAEINHDLATAAGAPVALCISPFTPEAGLETLVRAWRPLQDRWPEARLWIVGDGPLREGLFGMISDYNLKYRVALPGTFDDWCDLLAAADFLIQPTARSDWGLLALEAMAAGLPLIAATDDSALSPWHQKTALIVPRGDPHALSAAMEHLLEQPAAGVALGLAARQWIDEHHTREQMLNQYEQLLALLTRVETGVSNL